MRLDLILYAVVTAMILMSLEAVGNIPAFSRLITPGAVACMLTERLRAMVLPASVLGGTAALTGLSVSYAYAPAADGSIVCVLILLLALTWRLAPRHELLARARRRGRVTDTHTALEPTH